MTARRATQNLNFELRALSAPSAIAQKAMQSVGLSAQQVYDTLTHQGLDQAIQLITDAVGKKFPEGGHLMMDTLKAINGGATGLNVALMLSGTHMQEFQADVGKITTAMNNGKAGVMGWAQVQDTFNYKMSQLHDAFNVLLIDLGQKMLPVLGNIVQYGLTPLVNGFNTLINGGGAIVSFFQKNIWAADLLFLALGTLSRILIFIAITNIPRMILGLLDLGVQFLQAAADAIAMNGIILSTFPEMAGMMISSMIEAAGAIWAAMGPLILIGLAVTALALGAKWLYDNWKPFHDLVNQVGTALKNFAEQAAPKVGQFFQQLGTWVHDHVMPALQAFGSWITGTAIPALQNFWNWLSPKIGAAFSALGTFANNVKPAVGNFFSWLGTQAHNAAIFLGNMFSGLGTAVHDAEPGIGAFFSWLGTQAHNAATGIGNIFSGIGTFLAPAKPVIGDFFSWLGTQARNAAGLIGSYFSSHGGTALGPLFSQLGEAVRKLGDAFGTLVRTLTGGKSIGQIFSDLGTNARAAWTALQQLGGAIGSTLGPLFSQLGTKVHDLWNNLQQLGLQIRSTLGPFFDQLGTKVHDLWNNFLQLAGDLKSQVGQAFSDLGTKAHDLLQATQGLADTIKNQVGQAFSDLGKAMQPVGQLLQALWNNIKTQYKKAFDDLGNAMYMVVVAAGQFKDALGPTLTATLQNFSQAIQPLLPVLGQLAQLFGIVLVGSIVGGIGLIVSTLIGFLTWLTNMMNGLTQLFQGLGQFFTGLGTMIQGIVQFIVDLCTGKFGKLKTDLDTIWNGMKLSVQGMWTTIQGGWNATLGAIIGATSTFIQTVIGFFQNLYNTLTGQTNTATTQIATAHQTMASKIDLTHAAMADYVKRTTQDMSTQVDSTTQLMSNKAVQAFMQMQQDATGQMQQLDQNAAKYFADVSNYVDQMDAKLAAARHIASSFHASGGGTVTGTTAGHFASGGPVMRTAVYTVGEHGTENVVLPGGSYVYPHGARPSVANVVNTPVSRGGDTFNLYVNAPGSTKEQINQISDALDKLWGRKYRTQFGTISGGGTI